MAVATQQIALDVRDTILESFVEANDGYFYPVEANDMHPALVRVTLGSDGSYCVERRPSPEASWLPVVASPVSEFNANAWRRWRTGFPMVLVPQA